jgi:hypothetical protein
MGFEAVVFDPDDTLIVEADTARASMERVAAIVDKTDTAVVADLLFESAR